MLTKPQMCLLMRNGIEIWLESEKAIVVGNIWEANPKAALKIGDRILNAVDIMGIFLPEDLEDYHRTKRGQWKCKYNTWHNREDDCACGRNRTPLWRPPVEPTPEERSKTREAIDKTRQGLADKLQM